MTQRPKPTHRSVYVIGPVKGLQKIGIATDPRARLATLQTAVPFDLHLHLAAAVPFDQAHVIERRAHRLLARSCIRNEWFEASPADAIAAVKTAMAPQQAGKAPAEWQARKAAPAVAPLLAAGRVFRPGAEFHKVPSPAPLPLFEFTRPAPLDDQAAVDRALEALVKRIAS